jgi:hypothetical protein
MSLSIVPHGWSSRKVSRKSIFTLLSVIGKIIIQSVVSTSLLHTTHTQKVVTLNVIRRIELHHKRQLWYYEHLLPSELTDWTSRTYDIVWNCAKCWTLVSLCSTCQMCLLTKKECKKYHLLFIYKINVFESVMW